MPISGVARCNPTTFGPPGCSHAQVDVVICRTHLAAFFWHLEHVFEALRTAINRGKQEYPEAKYFWSYDRRLDEIEQFTLRRKSRITGIWPIKIPRSSAATGTAKDISSITFCQPSAVISPKNISI